MTQTVTLSCFVNINGILAIITCSQPAPASAGPMAAGPSRAGSLVNKEAVKLPSNVVYASDSGQRFVFAARPWDDTLIKGVAKRALIAADPISRQ